MSALVPVFHFVWTYSLVILCLGIIVSCTCRVGAMDKHRHRNGWSLMYVAMAGAALGTGLETLRTGELPPQHVVLGMLGIAANLFLTHHDWLRGPPRITHKNRTNYHSRASDRESPSLYSSTPTASRSVHSDVAALRAALRTHLDAVRKFFNKEDKQ